MPKRRKKASQTWKTFLTNHVRYSHCARADRWIDWNSLVRDTDISSTGPTCHTELSAFCGCVENHVRRPFHKHDFCSGCLFSIIARLYKHWRGMQNVDVTPHHSLSDLFHHR